MMPYVIWPACVVTDMMWPADVVISYDVMTYVMWLLDHVVTDLMWPAM